MNRIRQWRARRRLSKLMESQVFKVGDVVRFSALGERQCLARFEAGRAYPCTRRFGHDGAHSHPMDPVE